MSLYKEIIDWSKEKCPLFVQDAIRRLLVKPDLDDDDIEELILILKKEVGFRPINIDAIPATESDIPHEDPTRKQNARLLKIKSPNNISALWNKAEINLEKEGLNLIYGNNGSGKSSYARLLKKLCWSRHKDIELKTNIYTEDTSNQSVELEFSNEDKNEVFQWENGQPSHPLLNSIYIFDSNCASIYLNKENPTEYKPVGIDLLEKIILLCKKIDEKFDEEKSLFITDKPQLEIDKYKTSELFRWYQQIEDKPKEEIEKKFGITDEQTVRKQSLSIDLKKTNPGEENRTIQQKINRYETVQKDLQRIEKYFSEEQKEFIRIKKEFFSKKEAYEVAQKSIKGTDPLDGVGSEAWRQLWEAAKNYAITEVHPESHDFPSAKSSETCVFCQQPLGDDSRTRLKRFDSFIQDKTNKEFLLAKKTLDNKVQELESVDLILTDTYKELSSEIFNFSDRYLDSQTILSELKKSYNDFLNEEKQAFFCINAVLPFLSKEVEKRIEELKLVVQKNEQIIRNRTALEKELLELEALEYLVKQKPTILKYYNEQQLKKGLILCKNQISTTAYSLKIGEILDSRAIELQHNEFIQHLKSFNPSIASKVSIKKTRTTSGKTFQKCSFNSHSEDISMILSEGEQKIVALANFLSECTIDGATNSIIFDDPVNSLDQNYREAIGKKIVELSETRQIIVLTHDLYFLRLLKDFNKDIRRIECHIVGLESHEEISGIPSDEIPYLAKNVQERIDTIRKDLSELKSIDKNQISKKEVILERATKRMRKLLEKAIEEVLINKTIERFSKNINVKRNNLSSLVVIERSDIDFILDLFGKYSITEHDGGIETIPQHPTEEEITDDLSLFSDWKDQFTEKVKALK